MLFVLLICFPVFCLTIAPEEQTIMENFWSQLGNLSKGPNSTSNDACTWVGDDPAYPIVYCVCIPFLGCVYSINLENKGLRGSLRLSGTLPNVRLFEVSNNHFSGNISQILNYLPSLQYGIFRNNEFTGPITYLGSGLVELDVSSNQLALNVSLMPIPNQLKFLSMLDNVNLIGAFNDSLAACDLEEIRVNNIGLGLLGANLSAFLQKPNLRVVDVVNTGISGPLPSISQKMTQLILRDNNITGNLSWGTLSNSNLQQLDLSNNLITGIGDVASNSQPSLRGLLLANNRIQIDVSELFDALKQFPSVVMFDISGNQVFGDFGVYLDHFVISKIFFGLFFSRAPTAPFSNLLALNMSGNNLAGTFPSLVVFRSLFSIDLSKNSFRGSLPYALPNDALRYLAVSGNQLKASPPQELPSYASLGNEQVTDLINHIVCPIVSLAPRISVDIEWNKYLNLSKYCDCEHSYVYSYQNDSCVPCPSHTICLSEMPPPPGARLGSINAGFYPVGEDGLLSQADAGSDERPVLVRCRHEELCNSNPRTPPNAEPFACAEGHDVDSMLCSRCQDDYFSVLDVCYACSPGAIMSPIVTVIFLIILTCTVLRKQSRDGFEAGTIQIVLTWVQVTRILSEVHSRRSSNGPLGGDVVFPFLYSISVLAPVSIECSLGVIDYQTNLMLVFFAPLLFLCYAAFVGILAVACVNAKSNLTTNNNDTKTASANENTSDSPSNSTSAKTGDTSGSQTWLKSWINRTIFLWAFLLYAFYFQFCLVMFRALACEDLAADPAVDRTAFPYSEYTLKVLTHAPFVRCDQDLDISPLASFGTVFAILMPIAIVALVLFVRRQHPENWKRVVAPYLGFLTRHLRPDAFLWDMTMVPFRKLLLAVAIACYPRQGVGAIFMPLHVIGVLLLCVLAQAWVRPYRTWFDNVLETFLLSEQLLAFFLVVLTAVGEGFFRESDLAGVEVFVVFITWTSFTVCIVAVFRPLIGACLGKNKYNTKAQERLQMSSQDEKEMQEKST